jgi:FAD/FMN-containing dehydrogenase
MPRAPSRLSRRDFLQGATLAAAGGIVGCDRQDGPTVGDVAALDRVPVARIASPRSEMQLRAVLADSAGGVSVGGGRYSMGGQIAADHALHIDLRGMNGLVWLDTERKRVRVQAGMTWRRLQSLIDPHGLSVKVMQSYSNFTVGGSLGVNCHGRYVRMGPIVDTVRAFRLVGADGGAVESTPQSDLFGAVIGGYGGLGVVSEVELDLADNTRLRRHAERVALADYPDFHRERIAAAPDAVLHNADIAPPMFDAPLAITWSRTDAPLTEPARLVPEHLDYGGDQTKIWAASELPIGPSVRDRYLTQPLLHARVVAWRNHEASLNARSLEPRTRMLSTFLLQEYFIPVAAFLPFADVLRRTLAAYGVNALNVSIRHSPGDRRTLLAWAPQEAFSFVLYHKQRNTPAADAAAGRWTRRLIDAALDCGGRHYLPYRLHATPAQFRRAYPGVDAFARIKARIDPDRRFRNRLWDKYLPR